MHRRAILGKAVRVSFLGGIIMFLVSATVRAEKRGSVGEAVIVRMGSGCTGGRGRTGRSPGRGTAVAPVIEIGGGTPGSLALARPGFLGLEQWQSSPSLQRQTRAGRQRMSTAMKEIRTTGEILTCKIYLRRYR
ncbi:hypothetical protein F5888DRAFT_294371 [Russula emetica]|nr:hypothetical protein F5888DRAFT_294371 [Russula emetica]